ncbi:MAG: hypothetical protein K2L23_04395 [Odoribacter sp.]|nr:hypothetical protein [Odoribacter sp.]
MNELQPDGDVLEMWQNIPCSILLDENGPVLLKQMQTADFSNIEKGTYIHPYSPL